MRPCRATYHGLMQQVKHKITAHLTPYCSLGVLHLFPAQPLYTHVVCVRGVVARFGERRRITWRRQGWRRRWRSLGDEKNKRLNSTHTAFHNRFCLFLFFKFHEISSVCYIIGHSPLYVTYTPVWGAPLTKSNFVRFLSCILFFISWKMV